MAGRLRAPDTALAVVVTTMWGVNFVVIHVGLATFPPLLFAALRFALTAVPAVFFVRRPDVSWRVVTAVGLLLCAGQFGSLFVAIHLGVDVGLASVLLQCQAIFTVIFAIPALNERPERRQVAGLCAATAGLAAIGWAAQSAAPLGGLALCVLAGGSWGAGNVVARASRPARPYALLVYGAAVAPGPLLALSLVFEGPTEDLHALEGMQLEGIAALLFVVVVATHFGFGSWYRLLSKYPAGDVAPFTLLAPISGLISAWILLGEHLSSTELAGSLLAIGGLAFAQTRHRSRVRARPPASLPEQASASPSTAPQ